MMCRADEEVEETTITDDFDVLEEKPSVSQNVLIGDVTVSTTEESNSSDSSYDMFNTRQTEQDGLDFGNTNCNDIAYESICLDDGETDQSAQSQSEGTPPTQDMGYSVTNSPPPTNEVSFQELLNEAHYAISTGTINNVVDNLLDTHVRTGPLPSPVVPVVYCCEICAKTFTQMWILNKHYSTAHGFAATETRDCKKCGKVVYPRTKHCCFRCTHCVMEFTSKSALRDHVLLRHTQTSKNCEICNEQFPSQQLLTRHMIECKVRRGPQEETKDQLHCPNCQKVLLTFQHMKKHEQNYNSLSHACPVCEKRFCMLFDLFTHVWGDHHKNNRNAEYTCPVCEEVFKNFRAYTYHIYDVHEGHTEDDFDVWKGDRRFRERRYMYSRERYLARKNGVEKEQLSWDFEGEFCPRPEEDVQLEDFTRSSSRIERLNDSSAPTMLGKKKKVELLSLPDKPRKRRIVEGEAKAKTGTRGQNGAKTTKRNATKAKATNKTKTKAKSKAKKRNEALNK